MWMINYHKFYNEHFTNFKLCIYISNQQCINNEIFDTETLLLRSLKTVIIFTP